jgi:hypothetical protein
MSFLAPILPILGGGSLLSTVGTVAAIGGTILSGVSAYGAARHQQKVGEMNAKVAEENATRTRERAALEAQEQDTQTLALLGAQEAAQSASGLSLGGRSQILTRKAARELGRKDALNIRQAGEIEAYNYQVDAANQRSSAQFAGSQGTGSLLGSFLGAGQSLIGGARSTRMSNRFDPWVTRGGTSLRLA